VKLREYQARVLNELWAWFEANPVGNPIIDASVGAGKSILIAAACQRACAEFPGTRIVMLVPQKELLEQNLEKLVTVWPGVDVGVYSASVGRKQMGRQITYATIDSIFRQGLNLGRIDLILADECHLIQTKDTGKWRTFIADVRKHSPHARVIGWTGTPMRGNGVWLTAGEAPLFTHIASRVGMRELLDLGYLAPLVPAPTAMRLSSDGVRTSGDDYVVSELAKAVDKAELVDAVCDEIVQIGAGRRAWLVYCVTVEHAVHVCQGLQERGIACDVVTGQTPKDTRRRALADLRAGRLRALVNVAVLTTGFDAPMVDAIFLLRATKSPVLYNQICGRGMRVMGADIEASVKNGKADCLWADFTTTTATLGPVDEIKGRLPVQAGASIAPFKLCPSCGSQNPTGRLTCSSCGHAFPPPERIVHGAEASSAAVLSGQTGKLKTVEVDGVSYHRHLKPDAPDSVRVEYRDGLRVVAREWVAFSSSNQFARRKAEDWWTRRSVIEEIPGSTDDALEWLAYDKSILKTPSALVLSKDGKYDSIVEYKFNVANSDEPPTAAIDDRLAQVAAGSVDPHTAWMPVVPAHEQQSAVLDA